MQERIGIIGDAWCDILASNMTKLPKWNEDTLASINLFAGGSGLNTCVHGANYSMRICSGSVLFSLYSAVGDDSMGRLCKDAIRVDCISDNVLSLSSKRTPSCIILSGLGERTFVSDAGLNMEFSTSWFDFKNILSCSHIHCIGSYNMTTFLSEIPHFLNQVINQEYLYDYFYCTINRFICQVKLQGKTTSLNTQCDANNRYDCIEEICPYLDVILGNQV